MMDQDKKGSFSWGYVVLAIFVYGVFTSMINGANNAEWRQQIYEDNIPHNNTGSAEDLLKYELVMADGSHLTDSCWFADTTLFDETVQIIYVDYDPETKVAGTWYAASNTIALANPQGLTVQTISHEVSHMVDTFMEQQPDIDPHFEAYMQGYWTECVYQIVDHDMRCADDPWCNVPRE